MGFRFRRSFGVLPGVRINVGRRGASVSLGVRGAHMTVGPSGVRNTVGIPGTGMSYTTNESWTRRETPVAVESEPNPASSAASSGRAGWVVAGVLFLVLLAVLASP